MKREFFLRFFLAFCILYIPLVQGIGWVLRPFLASFLGTLAGCVVYENVIDCGRKWVIVEECTGMVSLTALISLAYALKIKGKTAAKALVLLTPVILLLNTIRTLLVILFSSPGTEGFFHAFTWPITPALGTILFLKLVKAGEKNGFNHKNPPK